MEEKNKSKSIVEAGIMSAITFVLMMLTSLPGIEGLVHISEITDENIAKPSDILELGQEVKVKILNIDDENKKMSLSIKDAVETSNEYMQYNDEEEGYSLADLFKGLNL